MTRGIGLSVANSVVHGNRGVEDYNEKDVSEFLEASLRCLLHNGFPYGSQVVRTDLPKISKWVRRMRIGRGSVQAWNLVPG